MKKKYIIPSVMALELSAENGIICTSDTRSLEVSEEEVTNETSILSVGHGVWDSVEDDD